MIFAKGDRQLCVGNGDETRFIYIISRAWSKTFLDVSLHLIWNWKNLKLSIFFAIFGNVFITFIIYF